MNGLWWFVVKWFAVLFVIGMAIIFPIVYITGTREDRRENERGEENENRID